MLGPRFGAGTRGSGRPARAPWLPQLALLLAIVGAVFLVAARAGAFERRSGGADDATAALARGDLSDDYTDDGAEGDADDRAAGSAALASSVRRCPSQKARVVYRDRRPVKCAACPSPEAAAAAECAPCEPPPAPLPREPSVDEALAILRRALTERGGGGGATAASAGGDGGSALASRIAASFAAYAELHARIMDPQDRSVPKRFVAWRLQDYGGAGLGNRLLGMVSTLALAVATNRAFLMYSDDVLSSVLAPAPREDGGIDWSWERGMAAYAAAHGGASPPSEHHQQGLGMKEFCACEDWRSGSGVKDAVPLLTLESTQYFFPCISHNPAYRPALRAMLGDSFEFFRHAMTRFIHLRPELRAELDTFEREVMRPPPPAPAPGAAAAARPRRRYVIGLQIRTGHLIRARHEEQAFYKCARAVAAKAAALHAAAGGSDAAAVAARGSGSVDDALAAIEAALGGGGGGVAAPSAAADGADLDVVYFLATDDGELRSRARQVFGDALLLYGGAHNGAVMDTFLLSRCDDVIITWPKSTFGSVGAALTRAGKPPHAVVSGAKRGNECVQLLSTEPCYHGWFDRWKMSCYSKERFETPEALNYDNCYYCQADTDRCPSEDRADQFLQFTSPLDYESLLEVGQGRYFLPATTSAAELQQSYAGTYADWVARVGAAPHPYVESAGGS